MVQVPEDRSREATDLSKERGGWDEWTGAAAWLAQYYWWHYEFNEDKEFLRTRAYPFMKQVAHFL